MKCLPEVTLIDERLVRCSVHSGKLRTGYVICDHCRSGAEIAFHNPPGEFMGLIQCLNCCVLMQNEVTQQFKIACPVCVEYHLLHDQSSTPTALDALYGVQSSSDQNPPTDREKSRSLNPANSNAEFSNLKFCENRGYNTALNRFRKGLVAPVKNPYADPREAWAWTLGWRCAVWEEQKRLGS